MDWKWIVDVFFTVILAFGGWAFSTLWKRVDEQTRETRILETGMASIQVLIAKDYDHKDDLHRVERQGKSDIEKTKASARDHRNLGPASFVACPGRQDHRATLEAGR